MYNSFLVSQERVPDAYDSSPKMTAGILDAGKEVTICLPYSVRFRKKKKKKALGVISSYKSEQRNLVGRWCEARLVESPCPSLLHNPKSKDSFCEWDCSCSQGSEYQHPVPCCYLLASWVVDLSPHLDGKFQDMDFASMCLTCFTFFKKISVLSGNLVNVFWMDYWMNEWMSEWNLFLYLIQMMPRSHSPW